jgi:hypothetical protein
VFWVRINTIHNRERILDAALKRKVGTRKNGEKKEPANNYSLTADEIVL